MILANVGLQIYNNWCSNNKNAELQQKREEFQRAAQERQTERMWRIMREGQELTLQLEAERHKERIEELKSDVGNLLCQMAHQVAIADWPLKVLPIVMKNQTVGNLLTGQEERIALHCIFTPSNYPVFNKFVFPTIEKELERYCNTNWNVSGTHPILFYSGGWRGTYAPKDTQFQLMHTELKNLPVLAITPLYRPTDHKLVFEMRTWGLGNNSERAKTEIEPQEFQSEYTDKENYKDDIELAERLKSDVVPYLECLIGYIADTYFWSAFGTAPKLPNLLVNNAIDTRGKEYLVDDCRKYFDGIQTTKLWNFKEQSMPNKISIDEKYGRKSNNGGLCKDYSSNNTLNNKFSNKYRF